MDYEVVIIGGGIGGLTAGALLSARGVNVGLFERASSVGGLVRAVDEGGLRFDPGAGLHAGWGPGEVHQRVCDELGLPAPAAVQLETPYALRLPDGVEVIVPNSADEFEQQLRTAFPECAEAVVTFYRELEPIAAALERTIARMPGVATASRWERAKLIAAEPRMSARILGALADTTEKHLGRTSFRFRRFIDAQLQLCGLCDSAKCAYLYAATVLTLPFRGLYRIDGGAASLATALESAIRNHGGAVHCNQTVLRLTRDADGRATGVDLLNGERVTARRAVISNLTGADTYAKLVGRERITTEIRSKLQRGASWGAYQIFLTAADAAIRRLPTERVLALTDWQREQAFDPEPTLLTVNAGTAPLNGRRAVTVSTFSRTGNWFAYDQDGSEHSNRDQEELERWWTLLGGIAPEIIEGAEVVATSTPLTVYDDTRRALGAVGGLGQALDLFGPNSLTHRTPVPGLYLVGDSVFPGNGIAAVTYSGLIAANEICAT